MYYCMLYNICKWYSVSDLVLCLWLVRLFWPTDGAAHYSSRWKRRQEQAMKHCVVIIGVKVRHIIATQNKAEVVTRFVNLALSLLVKIQSVKKLTIYLLNLFGGINIININHIMCDYSTRKLLVALSNIYQQVRPGQTFPHIKQSCGIMLILQLTGNLFIYRVG